MSESNEVKEKKTRNVILISVAAGLLVTCVCCGIAIISRGITSTQTSERVNQPPNEPVVENSPTVNPTVPKTLWNMTTPSEETTRRAPTATIVPSQTNTPTITSTSTPIPTPDQAAIYVEVALKYMGKYGAALSRLSDLFATASPGDQIWEGFVLFEIDEAIDAMRIISNRPVPPGCALCQELHVMSVSIHHEMQAGREDWGGFLVTYDAQYLESLLKHIHTSNDLIDEVEVSP